MNVRKSDDFVADVERQFECYALNAGQDLADRYLAAVEAIERLRAEDECRGGVGGGPLN
jgi:hypothetical protein